MNEEMNNDEDLRSPQGIRLHNRRFYKPEIVTTEEPLIYSIMLGGRAISFVVTPLVSEDKRKIYLECGSDKGILSLINLEGRMQRIISQMDPSNPFRLDASLGLFPENACQKPASYDSSFFNRAARIYLCPGDSIGAPYRGSLEGLRADLKNRVYEPVICGDRIIPAEYLKELLPKPRMFEAKEKNPSDKDKKKS